MTGDDSRLALTLHRGESLVAIIHGSAASALDQVSKALGSLLSPWSSKTAPLLERHRQSLITRWGRRLIAPYTTPAGQIIERPP